MSTEKPRPTVGQRVRHAAHGDGTVREARGDGSYFVTWDDRRPACSTADGPWYWRTKEGSWQTGTVRPIDTPPAPAGCPAPVSVAKWKAGDRVVLRGSIDELAGWDYACIRFDGEGINFSWSTPIRALHPETGPSPATAPSKCMSCATGMGAAVIERLTAERDTLAKALDSLKVSHAKLQTGEVDAGGYRLGDLRGINDRLSARLADQGNELAAVTRERDRLRVQLAEVTAKYRRREGL